MIDIEQIKQTLIDHGYQYKQSIGEGGFSCVFLCYSIKYKYDFAVKRTTKNRLTESEYETLVSLNHPYIIKLYDAFEDEFAQYLVMEYCQKGALRQKKKLNNDQFLYYAKQLLDALSFCHLKKIAHRDIKPENILFDQYDNCKLADFGIAKCFENDKSDQKCGTIRFFAPEIFQNDNFCPFKADIWALGITFYCMITGHYPFHGKTKADIKQNILIGELNFTKYDVDKIIRFLNLKMTQKSPNLRLSPDKLLNLAIFSQSSHSKRLNTLTDNHRHMTTARSMTFEAYSYSSSEELKNTAPQTGLPSCKCISLFPTQQRNERRLKIPKPV